MHPTTCKLAQKVLRAFYLRLLLCVPIPVVAGVLGTCSIRRDLHITSGLLNRVPTSMAIKIVYLCEPQQNFFLSTLYMYMLVLRFIDDVVPIYSIGGRTSSEPHPNR